MIGDSAWEAEVWGSSLSDMVAQAEKAVLLFFNSHNVLWRFTGTIEEGETVTIRDGLGNVASFESFWKGTISVSRYEFDRAMGYQE